MILQITNEIVALWRFLTLPDTVEFLAITLGLALVWLFAAVAQGKEV